MRITNLSLSNKNAWEKLVTCSPESGFMQSWGWSDFKAAQGQTVTRLGVFDGGELAGGALVYSVGSALSPLLLPHGPVLPWKDPAKAGECLKSSTSRLNATPRSNIFALSIVIGCLAISLITIERT